MSPVLFILFLFLLIVGGGVGIITLLERRRWRSRMRLLIAGDHVDTSAGKEKSRAEKSAEISKKLKEASRANAKGQKNSLPQKIAQAGLQWSVTKFWMGSFVFAAMVGGLLWTATGLAKIVVILLTITAFLGLPRLWLRGRAKKRQKKFLEDFADALDAMIRLLKAGMPVIEAIHMVGNEFAGPVAEEMRTIYEEQKVGVPFKDAVYEASIRMPIAEMQMFATGIAIQSETGSSMSEVLSNISAVIRARYRLKRKVVALSSEAKSSAGIIGALPILVGGGMNAINPEYISVLLETQTGNYLLYFCAFWMGCGVLVMRQMINFKV